MSYIYIYGAPYKARNFNVVYVWTYVWQRWKPTLSTCRTMFQHWINAESYPVTQLCVNTLPATKVTIITDGIYFGSLRVNLPTTMLQWFSDWLRAGRYGDRIPVGARFFAYVQTGPGAHPASCTMGTGCFPGVKRPGRGADHPLPPSAEVENEYSYTSAPPLVSWWPVIGWPLPLPFYDYVTRFNRLQITRDASNDVTDLQAIPFA
jgi:hypothetical protein